MQRALKKDACPLFLFVPFSCPNLARSTYSISGAHKLFPAYEVYINNQLVHDYSPIPGVHTTAALLTTDGAAPSVTDSSITSGTTNL